MPSLSALLQKLLLSLTFALFANTASAMFIQPDWLDPTEPGVGTNRYAYSANDPINKLDPGGNFFFGLGGAQDSGSDGEPIKSFMDEAESGGIDGLDSPNGLTSEAMNWTATERPIECDETGNCSKGTSKAARRIMDVNAKFPDEPIVIAGHSRGGAAAIRLANELLENGIQVDNLITLDPVAVKWNRQKLSSGSTATWHNYYIPKSARLPANSDAYRILGIGPNPDGVAMLGGAMGFQSSATGNFALSDWVGRSGSGNARPLSGHMAVVYSPTVFDIMRTMMGTQ